MKQLFKNIHPGNRPDCTKQLRYLFLCCLQAFSFFAISQKQHIRFEHMGTGQGLSQSNVICILQDSRGFIWVGTRDGLNRYDGYKFKVFVNDPDDTASLNNNFVQDIIEDSKGNIWVATLGGGLDRFDRKKNQFIHYTHDDKNKASIASDYIRKVTEAPGGNLWIATEKDGLDYFDIDQNQFVHYTADKNKAGSLTDNSVSTVFKDSRDNIWVGTLYGGLNRFDHKSKSFTYFQHQDKEPGSISGNSISRIFEDSDGKIWIGTLEDGLNLYEPANGTFRHYKIDPVNNNSLLGHRILGLAEDDHKNLWIGSENGGLSILDSQRKHFNTYYHDDIDNSSLSSNSVYAIYKDIVGNMWVGVFGGGINLHKKISENFPHYKHNTSSSSLSHDFVSSLYEDSQNNIWVGTDGGGLNLFNANTGTFTSYKHDETDKNSISGNYVIAIQEDHNKNIWLGTWGDGLNVFNTRTKKFRSFKHQPNDASSLSNNNVISLLQSRDKKLWIGTFNGLNLYNAGSDGFIHYMHRDNDPQSLSSSNIFSLLEDTKGNIWVGTYDGGLNLYDRKTNTFTRFLHDKNANSISNNTVSQIYEDISGNIWICTFGGLNLLNPKTGYFTTYTTKDGLPSNYTSAILEDNTGQLWISTNKGLSRFDPITKTFKNFTGEDGLQAEEFKWRSAMKSRSGAMYFGGINGFNKFFPDRIKKAPSEFPLVFTDFQLFNKKVAIARNENDPSPLKKDISETKDITVPYSNSVISFEFASLSFLLTEKKQYAYMLEGFDKTWNEVGTQRTATYTNLDPGKYVFKVKALNNEGNGSSVEASIKLTITPPFWMTWWFRIAVAIIVVGSVIVFYRVRINAVKRQRQLLQQKVKEQTAELVYSNKEEHKARLEADHANDELEKKNKELEQFVYIASHDLREPLRTTTGFVELFQKQYKGKLDEKADTYLSYITQSSDRMKMLIDDLLDYSKIGSKTELQQLDCNIILQEVIADLGTALTEAGAEIKADRLPVINGYPTGVKQLFQNLIANGIKFRKKDVSPKIQIGAEIKDDDWKFSFTDNGIGIDKQHSEKIFVIFQRLHSKKEYEGSGIGLAHCKKIVEMHNGNIWVESTPGTGSTFHFTIQKNNN